MRAFLIAWAVLIAMVVAFLIQKARRRDRRMACLRARAGRLIEAIEAHRATRGEYPEVLEGAGLDWPEARGVTWAYHRLDEGFGLEVGRVALNGFRLVYHSRHGWFEET